MKHKSVLALTLAIAAISTAVAFGAMNGHAKTASTATTTSAATTSAAGGTETRSAKKYRAKVVKATKAWLKTLTAAQRNTAKYSFTNTAAKQQWSNFPAFFKPRTGVSYKDMSATSTKAGIALVKATLSKQGYKEYADTRKADDYLAATDTGGGPGGPGGGTATPTPTPTPVPSSATSPPATSGNGNGNFGRNNFYISVFGTPSRTKPFMVSFNGHHMSFNITFNSTRLANTPQFNGTEPSSFILDKKGYKPMKLEAAAVFGMLPKLPAKAKLSQSFDDVLVGPQKDGQFPTTHSGVKVSSLPKSTQKYVTRLISAYVGDVPPAISKPVIARYEKQYSRTYVAYAGGTKDTPGTYLRIDGPRAWIEFCVQSTDKGSSHYHSVYRDKKHDYGA